MAVDGGDQRPEAGMPPLKLATAWAPGQDGIYFIAGFESNFYVNYLDFATHRLRKVADLPGVSFVWRDLAVSRNNDVLLFSGIDHGEADIMLVEGFR
jgi:hypothetical protein